MLSWGRRLTYKIVCSSDSKQIYTNSRTQILPFTSSLLNDGGLAGVHRAQKRGNRPVATEATPGDGKAMCPGKIVTVVSCVHGYVDDDLQNWTTHRVSLWHTENRHVGTTQHVTLCCGQSVGWTFDARGCWQWRPSYQSPEMLRSASNWTVWEHSECVGWTFDTRGCWQWRRSDHSPEMLCVNK